MLLHTLSPLRQTSTFKLINKLTGGRHLLFVATLVLTTGAGFAALFYRHVAAFATPSLGTAQSFAVLGASAMTNTGPTTVSGDLGVWPGTAVTGFPPGLVTGGVIHANDAVALQAQSDVTIAYNSLAGLPCNTNLTGQDLGGLTLAPGVYCFNSSAQLTGALALDAQGDPNAVFVFQIGSTLVTASNASVQVINGAQNCNAFWQVGSSATLGTGTSFIGSILALASITLNTNAILSGRALARTGAVTMDSNAITRTTCAPTLDVSFTPVTITVGGVSIKTITLSNPNTIAANITALTDTLPTGLVIAAPPNAASTCGGTLTVTAGGNTIALTGGVIPAGNGVMPGTCTITVNVTAALPGSYTNMLPVGALQTSNGSNTAPVSAPLAVICPVIDTTITAPAAVCALSTGNAASVPNAGGGTTYVWAITNGTITAGQGTPNLTFTAGTTSPVTLNVTVTTSPGCSANGSRQVTINSNPTASAGLAQALCENVPGPTVFTLNGTAGNGTPQWSVFGSTGTAAASIVTSNSATSNVNVTGNGTVTLRLTVTSNTTLSCGTASADVVLTVNANPAAAAGVDQMLCQTLPGPTVFNVTGTASGGILLWSVLATTGTATATIVSPNSVTTAVNVNGFGTVTLRLATTSANCGTATDDALLTINPLPVTTITALATVCALSPGNTASVPNAGVGATYNWTITGGTITAGQGTPNITYTASATGPVTLSVTVTTAAGCSANSSTNVTVNNNCAVDLSMLKTGSALVAYERTQFTYTLSVVNLGTGVATGVIVTDTLPAGLTLVSATPSQGVCSGVATITCNLGNLAAQATATIRLVVTFPRMSAGSVLRNTATVISNQTDIDPANNISTLVVPVEKVPPGPGVNLPPTSQVSATKSGSVLVFPYYTSDASNPSRTNTRISITNVENSWQACVHLFFVDGASCSVADSYLCLTPNQTTSFLMSDLDPGVSGYMVAVLVDCVTGCPLNLNTLIGDEYVKLASGHAANLAAEAIAGLPGATALCDSNSSATELKFDGVMYNQLPRVLALSNLGSRADGNDTLLVINRIGGDLAGGAATLGTLFGLLYNDAENAFSFSFTAGCQFRGVLTDSLLRTTPRLTTVIPAGRSGWLKLWGANDVGLFGVALNFSPNAAANAGAFNQGHNLHKLTLTPAASLTIPVFPPSC